MKYQEIFRPLRVGSKLWRNRIEVAPAAPFLAWCEEDGRQPLKAYYEQLAASGAAVVTLGISSLDEAECGAGMVRPACANMKLEELPELVQVLHRDGALASVELTVMRYMMGARDRISTMPEEEIRGIIDSYVRQAKIARDAGFDMLLIHGGHGNVPAQFFAGYLNRRTDRYGGSEEKRSRFAMELLDSIRDAVGEDLAIEYRISAEEILPGTTSLEETLRFAQRIQDRIDLLHVSRGLLEEEVSLPYLNSPVYMERGTNLPFAARFRQLLDIPVSVVCGMDLDTAEAGIRAGQTDAAAMIRTALADPHFMANALAGKARSTRPCVRCNTCINTTHTHRKSVVCAVNARIGHETEFPVGKAEKAKHVLIVGGGPAGLEAARTASARGHTVTLMEQSSVLGGSLRLAAAAEFKGDMRRYLDWSVRSVKEDPNVTLLLDHPVSPETVAEAAADAVILAVGAKPILPRIESCPEKALWIGEAELAPEKVGQKVVIAGAGFSGLEMALSLSDLGREVTVIDLLPEEKIGADGIAISMIWLKQALRDAGVRFRCRVRLEDATEEGAVVSLEDGSREVIPCDSVILSLGFRPDRGLDEALKEYSGELYTAGDCSSSGGTLQKAVMGGFRAAMRI